MRISVKRTIEAPSEELWAYLADYSNIHRFHPLLKGSHFTEGTQTCEIGSTRQCDMKNGDYLREKITDWKDQSHYSVNVYETSMPIKESSATLGVRPLDGSRTEVYMNLEMTPKYKIMAPVMYLLFKYFAAPSILKGLEKLHRDEHKLSVA